MWLRERRFLALGGVLLLAAVVRLQHVDQPYVDAFAWREADTASIAEAFAAGNWNIFLPQVRWGGSGPNYIGAEFQLVSYLAALLYRVVGAEPWVGRAVSIAFGIWGVFALYHLVRRVWDHPRAIASAAVMAVLPGAVFIERSFLPDGAMTALMTTSLWMLVAFGQTERSRYLWAAALFGVLGCLTKLPGGILVVPALYVVLALLGPKRLGERQLRSTLVTGAMAVAVPVVMYYLWARHIALSNPPYHFTGEGKFLWHGDVAAWVEKGYFLPDLWRIVAARDAYWGHGFVALAAAGLLMSRRLRGLSGAPWLFQFWLLAMAIRYVIEAEHLIADPYNLHLFHVPVAAFAGHALVSLGTLRAAWSFPGTLLAGLIFTASVIEAQWQSRHLYEDSYREHQVLGRTLAAMSAPRDLVVSAGPEPVVLYFSQRNGWLFPMTDALPRSDSSGARGWDHGAVDLAQLHELRARGARWLAVPGWNAYTGASGEEFLRRTYPALYEGILRDFEVVHSSDAGLILRAR